jgi:hypothetical protein
MKLNNWLDYKLWCAECVKRGLDGPYEIHGEPKNSYQFVNSNGTAAIWNGVYHRGSIFEQDVAQEHV